MVRTASVERRGSSNEVDQLPSSARDKGRKKKRRVGDTTKKPERFVSLLYSRSSNIAIATNWWEKGR